MSISYPCEIKSQAVMLCCLKLIATQLATLACAKGEIINALNVFLPNKNF